MLKVGVISNSDRCLPLVHYLKQQNAEVELYLGLHDAGEDVSSLLAFCNGNGVIVETEKDPEQLFGWLTNLSPDYCFMFCYRTRIDVDRLGIFKEKIFNIHPGRLPQYRGPSPVFWQLKNGENNLGITIHFINGKYDRGDIVWSREIFNEAHFSYGMVDYIFSNLLVEGVHYVLNTGITELLNRRVPQQESAAGYGKRPALAEVLINWKNMNAGAVINLVKACNPWNKGAITMYNNMEVKIVDAETETRECGENAGTIVDVKDGIKVACAGNSMVKINFLTVNGIFVPARFADKFGFITGQTFASF